MTLADRLASGFMDSRSTRGMSESLAPSAKGRGFFVEPLVLVVFKRGLDYTYFCSESGEVIQCG